jgi:hypothetical protein
MMEADSTFSHKKKYPGVLAVRNGQGASHAGARDVARRELDWDWHPEPTYAASVPEGRCCCAALASFDPGCAALIVPDGRGWKHACLCPTCGKMTTAHHT